jgi:aminoglycoside phosphotransferase (APT) family kinase protein
MSTDASGLPDDLRQWIEADLGGSVTASSRIGSGSSREIWGIELQGTDGPRSLVVRVDTGTGPVAGTALDLPREATVYRALQATGVPVPRLHAVEPNGRAMVMDRVHGEDSVAAVEDPIRRASIGRDYLGWLGRLHSLDVGDLDVGALGVPTTGPAHALLDLDLWSGIMRDRAAGWVAPSTELAVAWLREHAPEKASATSLCHGDAGPGNFLFDGERVAALLDWEFAHVGDPHDDLAWVAVRNHLLGRPFDLDDCYPAWREVTGLEIEPWRLEYYRVFVLTRMVISCDAAIAWKNGVVDESVLTHAILRPWLGTAIVSAIRYAGGTGASLDHAAETTARTAAESEHADFVAMIPPLEPMTVTT